MMFKIARITAMKAANVKPHVINCLMVIGKSVASVNRLLKVLIVSARLRMMMIILMLIEI